MSTITYHLAPAYGGDYSFGEHAEMDFHAGKRFRVLSISPLAEFPVGFYVSKRDICPSSTVILYSSARSGARLLTALMPARG